MMSLSIRFVLMLPPLLGAACWCSTATAGDSFGDFRAMWVSRFEYSTSNPASVTQVISNAASMGVTDVLFQVRAQGDAYYDSNVEPRAQRLFGTWDPLQTAIDAANNEGIRVHAWINTMPIWRGSTGPTDSSHPFYDNDPSLRRFNLAGTPENPLDANGEYASFNPVLDQTHEHINSVVNDIVTNYDVDGVHLDYIRWLGSQSHSLLPHDPLAQDLFNQATGLDAANPSSAPAYRDFIADRITDMVTDVKATVDSVETSTGRTIDLSAAVWRDPDIARNDRLQDYRTWLEQDLLDIVMPMIYLSSSNNDLLAPNLLNTLSIPTDARVAPGIGPFLHTSTGGGVPLTVSQLQQLHDLGAQGSTLFSYSNFFGSSDPLAAQRRAAVVDFFNDLEANEPPADVALAAGATVITDFEAGEGYFGYSPTLSGSTNGVFSATAEPITEEAHLGGSSQRLTIDGDQDGWFIRHLAGQGPTSVAGSPAGNLPLSAEGSVGLWIKTDSPGLSVQLALDDPGTADRGFTKVIVADGQWRLYEWDLSDNSQWEGWITGDGLISGPQLTLDSIQISGFGDAVVYLDTIAHNPAGTLAAPFADGDYDRNGVVDLADYEAWRAAFNQEVSPGSGADGNGDGRVDAADFTIWRDALADAVPPLSATPEPAAFGVLAIAFVVGSGSRHRGR
ncbi:MAG: family 10 glycosylhydrolase [Planctomycetota bacterium]